MFGFGDKRAQLSGSLDLMNELVLEYMEGMTKEAMASTFNGQLTVESLRFAIRKEPRKVDRVEHLIKTNAKLKAERDLGLKANPKGHALAHATAAAQKAKPKKRKATPAASADKGGAKAKKAKAADAKKDGKAAKGKEKPSKVTASVDNAIADGQLNDLLAAQGMLPGASD